MATEKNEQVSPGSIKALLARTVAEVEKGNDPLPTPGAALKVPLGKIRASPFQHRKTMDETKLSELMVSIESGALIQPIVVRPVRDAPGEYELVGGHRRLEAFKRLHAQAVAAGKAFQWAEIPVVVVSHLTNDVDTAIAGLAENMIRENPQPLDLAAAFSTLETKYGMSAERIGARFGWDARKVERFLEVGKANPKLLEVFASGSRTRADGKGKSATEHLDILVLVELLRLYNFYIVKKGKKPDWALARLKEMVKVVADDAWSFRQVEEEVRSLIKGRSKSEPKVVTPVYVKRDKRSFTFFVDKLAVAPPEAKEEMRKHLQELQELLA